MKKITYSVIDDVTTHNGDRVCFYFGFSPEGISFAAKKSVANEQSHSKAENYYDIFSWLGFNALSEALYSSPKFKKKYRLNYKWIIQDTLVVGTVNDKPIFFFTTDDNKNWAWTEDFADLLPVFGEGVENLITQALGTNFLKMYWEFVKEDAAQKKAYEGYLNLKQEQIEAAKLAQAESKEMLLVAG